MRIPAKEKPSCLEPPSHDRVLFVCALQQDTVAVSARIKRWPGCDDEGNLKARI